MNTATPSDAVEPRPLPPVPRLHRALMPDYNRKATVYWWLVVVAGLVAIATSALAVAAMPWAAQLQVLAGVTIAMVAGLFPVRIGRSRSSFAAGEIFIFLLLLLHGPAAATLAAAGEVFVGAMRTSRRWTSRLASPSMSALAMVVAGGSLQAALGALELRGLTNGGFVVVGAMASSLLYFTLNTLFVSAVPRLKNNQPLQVSDWLNVFGWVGIAIAGSGAVAGLLFVTYRQSGLGVLAAMVPIMAMLMATLHYYHRQQEVNEAMRAAAAAAAARESEALARAAEREAAVAAEHLQQLHVSERRFHSAFTHASIGMALLSFDGSVLQANDALRELLGVADADLLQHPIQEFVVADDRGALAKKLERIEDQDFEDFSLEMRCRHVDGGDVWVAAHCSTFSEPGTGAPRLILQAHDITARRAAENSLHHLAFHDSLTGLPNRRRFGDCLSQAVALSQTREAEGYAVMFLDFDRFKLINDSLGHGAGDAFLIQVAARIRQQVRPDDIVARLGGDEFAILMRAVAHEGDIIALAERLMQALSESFIVGDNELNTSASIGITSSRFGYQKPEDVLRDADIAMYTAKAAGKARYAMFDAALHTEVSQRLQLEGDLRRSIADGHIGVAYQPLFNLASGSLTGFEALARWTHPRLGVIGPDQFIPVAEDSGLIVALTDIVLKQACQRLHEWQQFAPMFGALTMSVNLSSKDLASPALVSRVTRSLAASSLAPRHLTLELTENILMERLETALPTLMELRALGIALSVDDFGTGYSSLAHLSSLPIDNLKVDRSFINVLRTGSKEATVVHAIVNLGNSLGKRVIAEGIETQSQFDNLRDMGCETGQGYHMSRPLAPAGVEGLLARLLTEQPGGDRPQAAEPAAQWH